MKAVLRAAILTAVSAAVLAACGETTIRADEAEQTVARVVFRETGFRATDVECPSDVEAKVGGTFECHFTGPEGAYTAFVRIRKVDGEEVTFYVRTRPSD